MILLPLCSLYMYINNETLDSLAASMCKLFTPSTPVNSHGPPFTRAITGQHCYYTHDASKLLNSTSSLACDTFVVESLEEDPSRLGRPITRQWWRLTPDWADLSWMRNRAAQWTNGMAATHKSERKRE